MKIDEDMAQVWETMALCALEAGSAEAAYMAASNYKEKLDSDAARLLLARCAIASGKSKIGEDLLQELLRKNPKDSKATYILSKFYKFTGKGAEAGKLKEKALKLAPDLESKFSLPEYDHPLPQMLPPAAKEAAVVPSDKPGTTAVPATNTGTASPATGDGQTPPAQSGESAPSTVPVSVPTPKTGTTLPVGSGNVTAPPADVPAAPPVTSTSPVKPAASNGSTPPATPAKAAPQGSK